MPDILDRFILLRDNDNEPIFREDYQAVIDEIVRLRTELAAATEVGEPEPFYKSPANMWRHAMDVTISHTIERCAQVVEDHRGKGDYIAAAIRAQKDK